MLIDSSYFYGDLDIPQKSSPAVEANVNWFIGQYEPKFLTALLGYELYRDFKAGIVEVTPAQKWLDLLNGKEYTNRYGSLSKWDGLRFSNGFTITTTGFTAPIKFKIGDGGANTPAIGGTVYTNSVMLGLTNADIVLFRDGVLKYPELDYNIDSAGGFTLVAVGDEFGDEEEFQLLNAIPQVSTTAGQATVLRSPIANYVYYWYMRNNATTTAGSGEASANVSTPVSPANKMIRAWDDMVEMNKSLMEFLYSHNTVYPGFDNTSFSLYGNLFHPRTAAGRELSNLLTPISIF